MFGLGSFSFIVNVRREFKLEQKIALNKLQLRFKRAEDEDRRLYCNATISKK